MDLHPPVWRIHRTIGMGSDLLVAAIAGAVAAVAGAEVENRHGGDQEQLEAGAVLVVDTPEDLVGADWDELLRTGPPSSDR